MRMFNRLVSVLLLSIALAVSQRVSAMDVFIDAGGDEYIDTLGNVWEADHYFTSGIAFVTKPAVPIEGTDDDLLYLTGRYSDRRDPPMLYDIPVDNGEY